MELASQEVAFVPLIDAMIPHSADDDILSTSSNSDSTICDQHQFPITQLNIGVLLQPSIFTTVYSTDITTATSNRDVKSSAQSSCFVPVSCQVFPKWFELTVAAPNQNDATFHVDSDRSTHHNHSFRFRIYYAAINSLVPNIVYGNGEPDSGKKSTFQLSFVLKDVPLLWKISDETRHWRRSTDIWPRISTSSTLCIGDCNLYQIQFSGHSAQRLMLLLVEALEHAGTAIDRKVSLTHREVSKSGEELSLDIPAICDRFGLEFFTRYHLEVCLTNGIIHKTNVKRAFIEKLSTLHPVSATRLLRTCFHKQQRIFDPESIFLQSSGDSTNEGDTSVVSLLRAVVKPTSVLLRPSSRDVSKRILRHFESEATQGRFLTVDFTDESCAKQHLASGARIQSGYYGEIFARMRDHVENGIMVAGRKYTFLMASTNQMRRNTAWFVATTEGFSVSDILQSIGDASHIRNPALYNSRMSLWLSSTHPISSKEVHFGRIPDIERHGDCFSDGVGKMSYSVMRTIARKMGLQQHYTSFSTVQFRLGGAKGVLTVDPNLPGSTILLRPSQEKFAGPFRDIEINQVAQYRPAHLDMQLVPILVALGVPKLTILDKVTKSVNELMRVTQEETAALNSLNTSVGVGRNIQSLARMIEHGFMSSREPFVMSCLRLWQTWSLKTLKEHFTLVVNQGATLLGCLDEIGLLKGWQNDSHSARPGENEHLLPEVFIQITDEKLSTGSMVVEGICAIARDPCLHPTDLRIVRAVNKAQLHHMKNCIVFPQTGELSIPKMCANGDLDGDVFTVIWDPDLLPTSWNERSSEYDISVSSSPDLDRPVTAQDVARFFMEFTEQKSAQEILDNLYCWADLLPDGVRSNEYLELARLAQIATDYPKHGEPVPIPDKFLVPVKPHWENISDYLRKETVYHSTTTLGRWFDMVPEFQFRPEPGCSFDQRILAGYSSEENTLKNIRILKDQYDIELRDVLLTYGVSSEFELWTSWILSHNGVLKDFNLTYKFGNVMSQFEARHKARCLEMAGVSSTEGQNWSKFAPFLSAMYAVTAAQAQNVPCNTSWVMPTRNSDKDRNQEVLTSFPWLFPDELTRMAGEYKLVREAKVDISLTRNPKARL